MRLKGVFFTMDAAVAVLITLLVIASIVSVLMIANQPDESVSLSRLSRDIYEIKRVNPSASVNWIKQGVQCNSADDIGVEEAIYYNTASGSVEKYKVLVCN